MTPHELERQYAWMLDRLREELAGQIATGEVGAVGARHFARLRAHATIDDYIPLLTYRAAKEELIQAGREELHTAA